MRVGDTRPQNARALNDLTPRPRYTGTGNGSPASAKRFLFRNPGHRQNSAMCHGGAKKISSRHEEDNTGPTP